MNKRFREEPEIVLEQSFNHISMADKIEYLKAIRDSGGNYTQTTMFRELTERIPSNSTLTDAHTLLRNQASGALHGIQLDAGGENTLHQIQGKDLTSIEIGRNDVLQKTVPQAVPGFFDTMWRNLSGMFTTAAENVANFFKQKNDAGELTEDPNYYRIAGVTMFFALMVFGVYKLIKWFRLRKEEKTVEMFNQSYKEYKKQIKENINFFNSLNKKFLKEDVEQSQNATVNKALDLAPQVAAYALEAEEKKNETKSIFKKYGYWILGAIAATVVICLYAYYGHSTNPTQTAIDLSTRTDGKIR